MNIITPAEIRVTSAVFPKIQGCQVHIFLYAKKCNDLINLSHLITLLYSTEKLKLITNQ